MDEIKNKKKLEIILKKMRNATNILTPSPHVTSCVDFCLNKKQLKSKKYAFEAK